MKINALTFIFTLFFYVSFGQTSEEIIRKNIEISFKGDSKKIISLLRKGRYIIMMMVSLIGILWEGLKLLMEQFYRLRP